MAARNAGSGPQAVLRFPPPPPPPHAGVAPVFPFPAAPSHVAAFPLVAPVRLPPPPFAGVPYYGGAVPGRAVAAPPTVNVQMRSVTAGNFIAEVDLIGSFLPSFPFVAVDTEYPGAVHRPPAGARDSQLTPDERYALVKANVDELPIVQLGVTLCDAHGNLPLGVDGRGHTVGLAWEVNFSDFDVHGDRHVPESVAFLRSQGVDFDLARAHGVSSGAFMERLAGVLPAAQRRGDLTWAAFGGAYDFGYLLKMLTGGQPLPETRQEFVEQVRAHLGGRVFDAKYMAEHCGRADLCGVGLKRVADSLGVQRHFPEPPCLAGPKSLTASRIHTAIRRRVGDSHQGLIDGLQ
ncbi:hypothetical protein ACP4OV_012740 [Aristida adscensionis]